MGGHPFPVADDPYGTGTLCRMTYMTGWVASYYWWRWRYTMDVRWLAETGCPAIRDCGPFYADFLEKCEDGIYHTWPRMQDDSVPPE